MIFAVICWFFGVALYFLTNYLTIPIYIRLGEYQQALPAVLLFISFIIPLIVWNKKKAKLVGYKPHGLIIKQIVAFFIIIRLIARVISSFNIEMYYSLIKL